MSPFLYFMNHPAIQFSPTGHDKRMPSIIPAIRNKSNEDSIIEM